MHRPVLLVFLFLFSATFMAADEPLRTRTFSFSYKATVSAIPVGAGTVEVWLPIAQSDPYQKITDLQIQSAYPYDLGVSPGGNPILHVRLDHPATSSLTVAFVSGVTRQEHDQPRLATGPQASGRVGAGELTQWLKPDWLVPIDGQIRQWATTVVTDAQAHTDLDMARAIYNHVVSTVKYDKIGKGWGRGDICYACDERRGNCTDFHAIFIGYCRAMGIHARFAIGFPLPADRGAGKIAGYHCWAEFYAQGIGWVPVDASEAAKNPNLREYFFGHHDENRIELSRGRDVMLMPKQKGEPLTFFVYPYAEVDGKPFFETRYEVNYHDAASQGTTAKASAF